MFLRIHNTGLIPLEAFTLLGLSTARGHSDKIGQFGSGAKHAICTLLRHNIPFQVFSGLDEIRFTAPEATALGQPIQLLHINGQPTSMTLGFGALDWNRPILAFRELISNAIDSCGYTPETISFSSSVQPLDGETTIWLPMNHPEVFGNAGEITQTFLHARGMENEPVLEKESLGKVRLYRKGVFVQTGQSDSLFDYNDTSEVLTLNESRTAMNESITSACAQLIRNHWTVPRLVKVLKSFLTDVEVIEKRLPEWWMPGDLPLKEALNEIGFACLTSSVEVYNRQSTKIKKALLVTTSWKSIAQNCGCSDEQVLGKASAKGYQAITPSSKAVAKEVWSHLEFNKLTRGKPFPTVQYAVLTDCRGFYDGERGVWINIEDEANYRTHIEEFAHYITEAQDHTRELQEFFLALACRTSGFEAT